MSARYSCPFWDLIHSNRIKVFLRFKSFKWVKISKNRKCIKTCIKILNLLVTPTYLVTALAPLINCGCVHIFLNSVCKRIFQFKEVIWMNFFLTFSISGCMALKVVWSHCVRNHHRRYVAWTVETAIFLMRNRSFHLYFHRINSNC